MQVNVLLIQLGQGADRLSATDVSVADSNLAGLLPAADVLDNAPAYHLSMQPLCKPEGVAILAEEADDPVCSALEGADRVAIHAQVLGVAVAAFGLD